MIWPFSKKKTKDQKSRDQLREAVKIRDEAAEKLLETIRSHPMDNRILVGDAFIPERRQHAR